MRYETLAGKHRESGFEVLLQEKQPIQNTSCSVSYRSTRWELPDHLPFHSSTATN